MISKIPFGTLLGAALFLSLTSTAQADDDDERKARIFYQKGNAAFKKGDSILARDYYKKSLRLHESFDTVCNLGRAQAQDKLYVEAYESLVWCAHLYPEDEELEDARVKFIRLRDEVRTEISPLEQRAVDRRVEEELAARMKAAQEAEEEEEEPPAAAPVPAEQSAPPTAGEKKRSKAALPVSLTIGGLGVVGLGVGTGFLVSRFSKDKKAEDLRGELEDDGVDCSSSSDDRCSELEDAAKGKDVAANVSTASFIAGGALLVGGIVTYLVWPKTRTVSVAGLELRDARPLVSWDVESRELHVGMSVRF